MTTPLAVVVTLAVLSLAGALPVRMLAGWRPATPFMAPIGGAVLAASPAGSRFSSTGPSSVGSFRLPLGSNAAATASWLARREARRSRAGSTPSRWVWVAGGTGVLAVAGATAWSLRSLVHEDIGGGRRHASGSCTPRGSRAVTAAPSLRFANRALRPLTRTSPARRSVGRARLGDNRRQQRPGRSAGARDSHRMRGRCVGAIVLEVGMVASAWNTGSKHLSHAVQ